MGCGGSKSDGNSSDLAKALWNRLEESMVASLPKERITFNHSDWRTIRIFLGCTFKDFRNERDILHKKIIPAVRGFCEQRKLMVIFEDLHAGRVDEAEEPDSGYLFMDTLEHCYQDNGAPLAVFLLGECTGYIPPNGAMGEEALRSYGIFPGLSLLEMQILLAAYRNESPNSLFMWRDPKFLSAIPFHKVQFIEEDDRRERAEFVRKKLTQRIPANRFVTYHCSAEPTTDKRHGQHVVLKNLDRFSKQITEFLKKRIAQNFHLEPSEHCRLTRFKENQFSKIIQIAKADVLQMTEFSTKLAEKISKPMGTDDSGVTLVTAPSSGGKTHALAVFVIQNLSRPSGNCNESSIECDHVKGSDQTHYRMFYHFASLTAEAQRADIFFKRILREAYGLEQADMPSSMDGLRSSVGSRLGNPHSPPLIIVLDDIEDMDMKNSMSWVPDVIPPQVKIIVSLETEVAAKHPFRNTSPPPNEFLLQPMDPLFAKLEINKHLHHVTRGTIPGIRPRIHKSAQLRRASTAPPLFPESTTEGSMSARLPTAKRRMIADELVTPSPESVASNIAPSVSHGSSFRSGARAAATAIGLRRHATIEDVETIAADYGELKTEFTAMKCRIMAEMLKYGGSLELVKALGPQPLKSVAKVELLEFESNLNGHLYIATLCLLAASKQGLREIELRHLLANEETLLPDQIKRLHSRIGFNFLPNGDEHGIQPIRWRHIWMRLRHHLIDFGGPGENRLAIGDKACLRAVQKRYLSSREPRKYWHGKLADFFEGPWIILKERRAEELVHQYIQSGRVSKIPSILSRCELLNHYFDTKMSHHLLDLWENYGGGVEKMKGPYTEHLNLIAAGVNEKWPPQELMSRATQLAVLFKQAKLYRSALKMILKAIEVESELLRGDPGSLGELHLIYASILDQQTRISSDFYDTVERESSDKIPEIMDCLAKCRTFLESAGESRKTKKQLIQCLILEAFWILWAERLRRELPEPQVLEKALERADRAKNLSLSINGYTTTITALFLIAQCELEQDKINEALVEAEEMILKQEGSVSPTMVRLHTLKVKLSIGNKSETMKEIRRIWKLIHQKQNPEKFILGQTSIGEL